MAIVTDKQSRDYNKDNHDDNLVDGHSRPEDFERQYSRVEQIDPGSDDFPVGSYGHHSRHEKGQKYGKPGGGPQFTAREDDRDALLEKP